MDLVEVINEIPGLNRKLGNLEQNPLPETPVLSAKIKLLWQCNLDCTFCHLPALTKPMKRETVRSILEDLKSHGLRKIHYSGGEIFLHPHIMDILQDSRDLDLQVNFTSNGTRITKEVARGLVEMGIHSISVSVDGSYAGLHDRLRAQKGAFKRTTKAIGYLVRYRNGKKKPNIRINTVVSRENAADMGNLHELLKSIDKSISWILMPVDSDDKKMRLNRESAEILAKQAPKWELLQSIPFRATPKAYKYVSKGLYAVDFYKSRPCYMPWLNVFIGPTGFVYPCCMAHGNTRALGNLIEQSVSEVLNGPQVQALRVAMASGNPLAICHRCDDVIVENSKVYGSVHKQISKDEIRV